MFKSTLNRGFQMEFKNGITISVQFGTMNYCDRKDYAAPIQAEMGVSVIESNTAEIAIWDKEEIWFDFGSDTVKGWVDADEVATWIMLCTAATSISDLRSRAISCEMIEKA